MNRTALRLCALTLVTALPTAFFYGCSDDESAKPGAGADAAIDSTSNTDGSSSDATSSGDTGGGDSAQNDAANDAPNDAFVLPTNPCATFVDAGADADAGDADAGDAAATTPTTARQVFSAGMVGCSGKVTYANRAQLCNAAAGCTPCTASEWVAKFNGTAPAHQYWVDEALRYTGTEFGCGATTLDEDGGTNIDTCSPASQPMRVCVDGDGGLDGSSYKRASQDENGNRCNWTRCDFGGDIPIIDAGPDGDATAPTNNLHFGGCNGNVTAGALCCCK